MYKRMVFYILALLLIGGTATAKPFVFTAIPDEDGTRLRQRFDKVSRYLTQALKVEVKFIPVKSYAAAVAAFKNNQVQMAWFGGLSGVRARRAVKGARAIAQGYEDQFFVTYFIANSSTGLIESHSFPKAISGKTFTFGSKGSTSGRLMPEFHIRKHLGKSPDQAFRKVGFSGDHSRTIALVQAGTYQVGAVNFKVWENELKAGKIDPARVRIIWRTPEYPDYQWTVRGDIERVWGAGFIEKTTAALLNIQDRALLEAFPRKRFVPAKNEDYRPILETARSIGLID